ncbi:hypothetical protein HOP50_04g28720 [Chloropicon primus]|uniref:BED-type domain-containing protein n=2 Tax=Chloropicon primus TaxID=1764295 RepID=A0A5B8MIP1_9CHLO|nr:hypothetical protein A3770_04p28740 [Chloropicon primus]UPQ99564.1 hypothetical protein HOP50_04g28720 [Chloropicon primus]|mmetsp:Transcript_26357/g.56266  ORF Transcript_26357/g.56266 Transcript_26357/m.56266 type:complete len:222 (+) Transcript_26357:153-818(+)|eukprot:QDZ20356.1 hypothetical protein A3770_04p28740 [Chloropicon primus]
MAAEGLNEAGQPHPVDQVGMVPDTPECIKVKEPMKSVKYGERKDSASWVYDHWEPVDDSPSDEKNPKRKFKCKYCKNAQYRHNVTRMRNHLLSCSLAPQEAKDIAGKRSHEIEERKNKKAKTKRGDDGDKAEVSSKKNRFENEAKGICQEGKKILDHSELHSLFARAIAALKLGPDAVENDKLKKFIHQLCPDYEYPTEGEIGQKFKLLKLSTETFENHTS